MVGGEVEEEVSVDRKRAREVEERSLQSSALPSKVQWLLLYSDHHVPSRSLFFLSGPPCLP
jgi:hypothetical protein